MVLVLDQRVVEEYLTLAYSNFVSGEHAGYPTSWISFSNIVSTNQYVRRIVGQNRKNVAKNDYFQFHAFMRL